MIKAQSADAGLNTILHGSSYGKVHSVYNKIINIMNENKIIAIGIQDVEPAPDTIITDYNGSLLKTGIQSGDDYSIKDGLLTIKDNMINLNNYVDYEPKRNPVLTVNKEELVKLLKYSEKIVNIYGMNSPLYKAYFNHIHEDAMTAIFYGVLSDIKIAVREKNKSKMITSMYKIYGLGIGLTPSGDDFIAGMSLVLVNYDKEMSSLLMNEYEKKTDMTGYISRQIITNAINGRGRMSEVNLICSYFAGDMKNTKKHIHQVLEYGSSSGTDTMCGIMMGLFYILNERKEDNI